MPEHARLYLDPGDNLAGRYEPPRTCVWLNGWKTRGGPHNCAVQYLDDGSRAVIPSRRLRRLSPTGTDQDQ